MSMTMAPPEIEIDYGVTVDESAFDILASGEDDGWFIRLESDPSLPARRHRVASNQLNFVASLALADAGRRVRAVTIVRDNIDYWTLTCDFRVDPTLELTVIIRRS